MSTIEVATAEPTAPHRACSQLMIMGLPDATLHRFILGLDGRPQQLVDGDALAQLGDDFATLLLRKGVFPRTAGEVLAGLVSATPDGHPLRIQRFFLVGEGSQIPRQAAPVARNLRFVVACGRGPEGANIILSSFHPDQGVVEVIAWDSPAGGFNFYRTMPDSSAWVFAGNSRHALVGPTRGNGPFESHVNGHFLMKELNVPWVNWHSPFATVSASVLTEQGLEFHPWVTQLEPGGAYTLEDDIARPAIKRWTTARVSAMSAGTALETPRRFAEQLLDTLTVNLISSRTSSAAAMSGAAAPVDLPASFFVDAASLELVGVLPDLPAFRVAADVYTAVMRSVGARLDDGAGSEPLSANYGMRLHLRNSGMMADNQPWRVGRANAPAHHGEILQGTFVDDGRLRRGLVTLPCPMYSTRATFVPQDEPGIRVSPPSKVKARRAGELAVAALGPAAGIVGGHLHIYGDAPVRRGFGSSTSDVLAAVGSVSSAFDQTLAPEVVGRLAVQAELASDSLMFEDSAVLFAHRTGEIIEDFSYSLPRLRVLGFGSTVAGGSGRGAGVDTISFPPARYTDREIAVFGELRDQLRDAICSKDVELVGDVATASTLLNQRHLPVADLSAILRICRTVGAAGLQVAHSGDIAGILYDPDIVDVDQRIDCARELLGGLDITDTWTF